MHDDTHKNMNVSRVYCLLFCLRQTFTTTEQKRLFFSKERKIAFKTTLQQSPNIKGIFFAVFFFRQKITFFRRCIPFVLVFLLSPKNGSSVTKAVRDLISEKTSQYYDEYQEKLVWKGGGPPQIRLMPVNGVWELVVLVMWNSPRRKRSVLPTNGPNRNRHLKIFFIFEKSTHFKKFDLFQNLGIFSWGWNEYLLKTLIR